MWLHNSLISTVNEFLSLFQTKISLFLFKSQDSLHLIAFGILIVPLLSFYPHILLRSCMQSLWFIYFCSSALLNSLLILLVHFIKVSQPDPHQCIKSRLLLPGLFLAHIQNVLFTVKTYHATPLIITYQQLYTVLKRQIHIIFE